jgi:hypothetical protein
MSPRIIHIPLSGGDRKAQAKGIRYAHGIHESAYRESVLIRSAAEAKIREADRLECEAWNAIMWAGGPAMPPPGDPQAEPTIGASRWCPCEPSSNRRSGNWKPRFIASRAVKGGITADGSALTSWVCRMFGRIRSPAEWPAQNGDDPISSRG